MTDVWQISAQDWLASLSPRTRTKAQRLLNALQELHAPAPIDWVRSEIVEDKYQMAYAQAQAMQIKRASVQIAYSLGEVCEAQNNAAQAYA